MATKDDIIHAVTRVYDKLDEIEDMIRQTRRLLDELPQNVNDFEEDEEEPSSAD